MDALILLTKIFIYYFLLIENRFICMKILHLCTFKTPTCRRFMSAKVGSLCAFKMRKGVELVKIGQSHINSSIV